MSGWLEKIAALDKEINSMISEFGNENDESPQTKKNVVDSTEKNIVSSTKKNVVEVTSKNFVSSAVKNVIKSPFIKQKQNITNMSVLKKSESGGGKSKISERISGMFNF